MTTFPLPVTGKATMQFFDGEQGSFGYAIGADARTMWLQRFIFGTPAHVCAAPAN